MRNKVAKRLRRIVREEFDRKGLVPKYMKDPKTGQVIDQLKGTERRLKRRYNETRRNRVG